MKKKLIIPASRKECIQMIDDAGKREEFESPPEDRTLEEYFDQYQHKEPDVWLWVLADLGI